MYYLQVGIYGLWSEEAHWEGDPIASETGSSEEKKDIRWDILMQEIIL